MKRIESYNKIFKLIERERINYEKLKRTKKHSFEQFQLLYERKKINEKLNIAITQYFELTKVSDLIED